MRHATIIRPKVAVTWRPRELLMGPKRQHRAGKPDAKAEAEKIERRERLLDEALQGTFPASDPPAVLAPHSSNQ